MKKLMVLSVLAMVLSFSMTSFAKNNRQGQGMYNSSNQGYMDGQCMYSNNQGHMRGQGMRNSRHQNNNIPLLVDTLPYEDLNEVESASLGFMLEEEKLARDVYITLGEKWNLPVFLNIARAEQTHMNAISALVEKYGIENNINDENGVFNNADLQTLYNELTAKGSESVVSALTVGATIEDLDINDLETYTQKIDNQDITLVYQNLTKGSGNHLRAFVRQLSFENESYTPQFISVEEYNYIISSDFERGLIR